MIALSSLSQSIKKYLFLVPSSLFALLSYTSLSKLIPDDNIVQSNFNSSNFWIRNYWPGSNLTEDYFAQVFENFVIKSPILDLIYKFAALVFPSALSFSKIMPIILGFVAILFAYFYFQNTHKDEFKAMSLSLFLIPCLWSTDQLISMQSQSFIWPGIFIYLFLRSLGNKVWSKAFSLVLLFISPTAFLICIGTEAVNFIIDLFKSKAKWLDLADAVSQTVIFILYNLYFAENKITEALGEKFSLSEMKELAEFNREGRLPIFAFDFNDHLWWFSDTWGPGIGFLPIGLAFPLALLVLLLFIAFISIKNIIQKSDLQPEAKLSYQLSRLAPQEIYALFIAALLLHLKAHLFFPLLSNPSIYLAIPMIIFSICLLNSISHQSLKPLGSYLNFISEQASKIASVVLVLSMPFLFWSYFKNFYYLKFVKIVPRVKELIDRTPEDAVLAAYPMLPDINLVASTTNRKFYIDLERSYSYYKNVHSEIRRRNEKIIEISYAKTKKEFLELCQAEGITHFMAFYNFYDQGYTYNPKYLEPYNSQLRKIMVENSEKEFYVKSFLLARRLRYAILDVDKMLQEKTK